MQLTKEQNITHQKFNFSKITVLLVMSPLHSHQREEVDLVCKALGDFLDFNFAGPVELMFRTGDVPLEHN